MSQFSGDEGTNGEEEGGRDSNRVRGPAGSSELEKRAPDEADEILSWLIEAARTAPDGSGPHDALEEELSGGLAAGLGAREHMLDLIRLARDGLLPELDSDLCRILAVMLAEISAWVAEYDLD